jgi:CheY-like chemotaxis protein
VKRLLVIEDGDEYQRFAEGLLSEAFSIEAVHDAQAALRHAPNADCFLVDLRFDRTEPASLVGDLDEIAQSLFGGDRARGLRHQKDEQGIYILRALRQAGYTQRAVFVHDFAARRLDHLRARYGDVDAVESFDARALRERLEGR